MCLCGVCVCVVCVFGVVCECVRVCGVGVACGVCVCECVYVSV